MCRWLAYSGSLLEELVYKPRHSLIDQSRHARLGVETALAAWSTAGPVAYVEAEYFEGIGTQVAAVWDAGELVLGPIAEGEDAPPVTVRQSVTSQALGTLVVRAHGHVDEFDAVGLVATGT